MTTMFETQATTGRLSTKGDHICGWNFILQSFLLQSFVVLYLVMMQMTFSRNLFAGGEFRDVEAFILDSFRHVAEPSVKILVYMSTSLSEDHLQFLPCWANITRRLEILKNADLLLYSSTEPSREVLTVFQNTFRRVRVQIFEQPDSLKGVARKQQGAIGAMIDPFNNNWFRCQQDQDMNNDTSQAPFYDWVIRLNPDVLIRHDSWFRSSVLYNHSIDAVVAHCFWKRPEPDILFHTDFNMFRPAALDPESFCNETRNPRDNAERHFTRGVSSSITDSTRIAVLPGTSQQGRLCRLLGVQSPVVHHHGLWKSCPHYANATDGEWY